MAQWVASHPHNPTMSHTDGEAVDQLQSTAKDFLKMMQFKSQFAETRLTNSTIICNIYITVPVVH